MWNVIYGYQKSVVFCFCKLPQDSIQIYGIDSPHHHDSKWLFLHAERLTFFETRLILSELWFDRLADTTKTYMMDNAMCA